MEPPPKRSRRALAWVSTANFGEGLPWSFLHQMATEFLTAAKASNTQIGATSLFHLAVTFKFLWSPVVDLFGRKRSWVIATQVVLAGGMVAVAAASAAPGFALFWVVASLLAVVHATHDIACDGFYIQALDDRDQALYSGVRTAAFRVAMIVGSSVLVYLAGRTSWVLGFSAAGLLMLATALVNAALLPRPGGRAPAGDEPGEPGAKAAAFWAAYRSFLAQPQAALVLAFMFFYRLGDIMMFAMSKPLLRDIGVDTAHRGLLNGLGTFVFIVGSIVGGGLIARRSLARTLVPILYLQNLAIPLYIAMAVLKPTFGGVIAIVLVEQLVSGIGASAHVVFLIQRSRGLFSASHYAFATAVVSLGSTLSGYLSGPLNQHFGHPIFFTLAFVAGWPALVLVWFVPKKPVEEGGA
ncbi:MAG TPA: MFS transporter [Polyangia bacterium]|jgi:PAT family beta-lactamase induction signal transducer AmpG